MLGKTITARLRAHEVRRVPISAGCTLGADSATIRVGGVAPSMPRGHGPHHRRELAAPLTNAACTAGLLAKREMPTDTSIPAKHVSIVGLLPIGQNGTERRYRFHLQHRGEVQ